MLFRCTGAVRGASGAQGRFQVRARSVMKSNVSRVELPRAARRWLALSERAVASLACSSTHSPPRQTAAEESIVPYRSRHGLGTALGELPCRTSLAAREGRGTARPWPRRTQQRTVRFLRLRPLQAVVKCAAYTVRLREEETSSLTPYCSATACRA